MIPGHEVLMRLLQIPVSVPGEGHDKGVVRPQPVGQALDAGDDRVLRGLIVLENPRLVDQLVVGAQTIAEQFGIVHRAVQRASRQIRGYPYREDPHGTQAVLPSDSFYVLTTGQITPMFRPSSSLPMREGERGNTEE